MDSEGQRLPSNPPAMLSSLLGKRAKLHEELRSIEKQVLHLSACPSLFKPVYEMETSYLQDPSQCGNVLKGFEGFLSASKSTALLKSLQGEEMMGDQILELGDLRGVYMPMGRENQRREDQHQEMQRKTGLLNKILTMKMILI
ncbi:chromatin modification-related protein eaf6 isoform X3 [Syzygium oleosum]|uniref:chromatin modification-related protein eaf6 isoform X3 n=1 Tax=Syzygium oleosum TaxID=219896 RepID=UPI0024B8ACA7|nr:chromatin modification-related protein eaf6 isoform X3 [Syzygium oleosum]